MDIPGTSGTNSYQQWAHVIECPICYSIYDKPLQMGCGHTLCVGCVDRLVEQVKAAAADEGRNLPPQMPRVHFEDQGVVVGLGGLNDQIEEQGWVEIPGIDQRNPGVVRGLIGFPPRRRADNESTEIKCPECRKPTVVPQGGLPVNYRVQEIVHKVAPLFKDRHLVKHCKQCDSVLNQGVYFDCGQCGEEGNKICSTCAIRLHNGHELVEKKALTSEDVVKMKKLINDASHRAFQSYENVKPRLENVGGVIEAKVKEKMSGLIKIFEFILAQFESKINDTVTMDELMIDVKKAEDVAEAYNVAKDRIEVMLTSIELAFDTYWEPFQQIRTLMEFEEPEAAAPAPAPDAAPAAAAPPAPAANPAPVQNPAPAQNPPNNIIEFLNNMNNVNNMNNIPQEAIRVFQQMRGPQNGRAVAHFAQVDRQRNRVRMAVGGPPPNMRGMQIWGHMGHPQMAQGPMRPGPGPMGPGQMGPGPGQMGPVHIRQGPPRMMQQPPPHNPQGGPPQLHPMQMQHQQHQHQQQQHQQQHQQQQHQQQQQQQQNQPPNNQIEPAMMEFLHFQAQLQRHPQNMGPMQNGNMVRMNNGGNMPNLQQMQQHVPMPPQMPNFQQPQQQPPPQQRHPMPHEMGPVQRHPPMPPPNVGQMMHHHPGYQMRVQPPPPPPPQQQQQPHFHNQGGVQAQQLHHQLQQLQQLQQMQQEQQVLMEQNEQRALQQQQQHQQQQQQHQQQQMQQMAEQEVPEPREDIPRDPDWDNIPDNNAPQFEMQFDNPVEEEPINEEEMINPNQNMVQQLVNHIGQAGENYRAGDINMIQFQEDNNAIRMVPIEDNNQQNIIMVQGDGLGDDGMPDDDDQNDGQENQDVDDEQDQFEDPEVPAFVEFQQQIHEDINALEANIQQVHIEQQQDVDLNPIIDIEPVHPVVNIEQIHDPVMQLDQFVQVVPVQQHQEGEENGLMNDNLAGVAVQEDDVIVIEDEQPAQQPTVTRRNQRRELVPEAETRRSVRRSLRNSTAPFEDTNAVPSTSEASTSTGATARSLSPSNSVKRRRIDKRVKQELPEPEEMEAEEPVDPAPRPTKRRAAHMASSSSSAGPSTSAPTTRSQTRS
ncbi:unnamed protein product [Caenorhabditis brenneri]